MDVSLDAAACGDLAISGTREWLVTNGLGGFAAGTIAGLLTRRYHGILFAARLPPVGRMLLCPKIDATAIYDGRRYDLATDRWADGTLAPRGYVHLTGFRLDGSIPVWTFTCADAVIERRVWMEHGANCTYVAHRVVAARAPLTLELTAFVNMRDLHSVTQAGDWMMEVRAEGERLEITPFAGAAPIALRSDGPAFVARPVWYRGFDLAEERARGLDDREDHLCAGTCSKHVAPGQTFTVAVADHALDAVASEAALARRAARDTELRAAFYDMHGARAQQAPPWLDTLVIAADAFVVKRPLADDPQALSVIAGYPWFGDWGRDTAIALPGLALATGRLDVARSILRTFARFIDRGMLPNYFPDGGEPAEYNTVDAALWYVRAVDRYYAASGDLATLREVFPAVRAIIDGYTAGTRFGIGVDSADGLLHAGQAGVALTWMDAKVDEWVVTPRIGKPVEINALWIEALNVCARSSVALGGDGRSDERAARRAAASFERFWSAAHGWCFDVIDGPAGADASLRPNQIFAVALPIDVLDEWRRRAIVDVCARRLWTPAGLRSLDPADPAYRGSYGGDRFRRDGAYHQGTVWAWLAGPFACAVKRVAPQTPVESLLAATAGELAALALGTLAEIADGDAPFRARGAVAQAWSVATVLDAWLTTLETRVTGRAGP